MMAQPKPKKPRSKPSGSYEPPAQQPIVAEPSYQEPSPAYPSTDPEPILYKPPPRDPPAYAATSVDPIKHDPPHPYEPPAPAYQALPAEPIYVAKPVYNSPPAHTAASVGSTGHDPGPTYQQPPRYPSGGSGSSSDDPYSVQFDVNGPQKPHLPSPGVAHDRKPGQASAYPSLVSDTSAFTAMSRQNIAQSGAATQDGMLGTIATNAIQDVLGWQIRRNNPDPKGFLNALNQSFSLKLREGHVQAIYMPHTHLAQNDVAGGLAGSQASIYTMANTMLEKALPLLDGLSALKPGYDEIYVEVLQQTAASQLRALVGELGYVSGPRIMRVNQCFHLLLGIPIPADGELPKGQVEFWTNPDTVGGVLGNLRAEMGLGSVALSYVNNVADEQNVTNFRCIVDYINAIFNSWRNSMQFFKTMQSPFLGTQLVWISMQLGVVNEAVEELLFGLDTVFITDAERKTLVLSGLTVGGRDGPPSITQPDTNKAALKLPDITLSGLLGMIQSLVTQDGPDIILTGGRFGIGDYFTVMVAQLHDYVSAAIWFAQAQGFSALNTHRILVALAKVKRQLLELYTTAAAVGVTELRSPPVK